MELGYACLEMREFGLDEFPLVPIAPRGNALPDALRLDSSTLLEVLSERRGHFSYEFHAEYRN